MLGVPTFNTEARVIDPVTLAELPPNEIGEIIVSGPQVFKGYWGKPEATKEAFIEFEGRTYFRTGDRAAWTRKAITSSPTASSA